MHRMCKIIHKYILLFMGFHLQKRQNFYIYVHLENMYYQIKYFVILLAALLLMFLNYSHFMTVTSLYKWVLFDMHLNMELKSSDGSVKVMVEEYKLFDNSCSTVPEILNIVHFTISFWYIEVHVKDNLDCVPLTTKSLIIDPFSTSLPLLLIMGGPGYTYNT